MSDENDKPDSESSEDEATGPLCGERLAESRRAQQIPLLEIAKELHLDEYKVRAIESNDFEVLGAPVFAKGHLRKYAQLVNVDEADVMDDYYRLNRAASAQPVIKLRPKPRRSLSPGPWIALVIVLLLVAAAYWWFGVRQPAGTGPAPGDIRSLPTEPQVDAGAQVDDSAVQTGTDGVDEVVDQTAGEIEAVDDRVDAAEPPAEPEPAAADGEAAAQMTLSVTYTGDCWTEITDAMGRRLYFDLGKAGDTVNLSGEPPFNALFGDAANVSLLVNGSAYDIPASERSGRMARLTITAP